MESRSVGASAERLAGVQKRAKASTVVMPTSLRTADLDPQNDVMTLGQAGAPLLEHDRWL